MCKLNADTCKSPHKSSLAIDSPTRIGTSKLGLRRTLHGGNKAIMKIAFPEDRLHPFHRWPIWMSVRIRLVSR